MEGDRSGHWLGFLTRQVMENSTSYDDAFKVLSTTKMLAPAYFILGGNSSSQVSIHSRAIVLFQVEWFVIYTTTKISASVQGALITRSSKKALDTVHLRQPSTRWFLLQTNYDNWKQTPFYDKRREAGVHCMEQVCRCVVMVIVMSHHSCPR